jgi:hypothetical protein
MMNSMPTTAIVRGLGRKLYSSFGSNYDILKALVFKITTPDNSSGVWA